MRDRSDAASAPSPGTPGEGRVRVISNVESCQQFEITLILTFSQSTGRRDQRAPGV